jgi:hypothetical protein
MIHWILSVTTEEQREAVYKYLKEGDKREDLAKELHEKYQDSWLKYDSKIMRRLRLMVELAKEYEWESPSNTEENSPQWDDGTGDTKWGERGEHFAKNFYEKELGYINVPKSTKVYDFLFKKDANNEEIEVEVKTISSPAIRLPKYEWARMISSGDKYEIFIIHHDKEHIIKLIRIKKVNQVLKAVIDDIKDFSPTTATKDNKQKPLEPLISLQWDESEQNNVIILNWERLFQECYHNHQGNIEIYQNIDEDLEQYYSFL